jgi:hypothetical protein
MQAKKLRPNVHSCPKGVRMLAELKNQKADSQRRLAGEKKKIDIPWFVISL